MNTSYFQHEIGGTSPCTKRILQATKGCSKLSLNDTFFSDSLFRRVKIAEGVGFRGSGLLWACEYKSQEIFPCSLEKIMI